MPIYEYQCNSCMREFEELAFGDATPLCPHCHSANTAKVMSRPCACRSSRGGADGGDWTPPSGGGGCAGCSGGSCATCGSGG